MLGCAEQHRAFSQRWLFPYKMALSKGSQHNLLGTAESPLLGGTLHKWHLSGRVGPCQGSLRMAGKLGGSCLNGFPLIPVLRVDPSSHISTRKR